MSRNADETSISADGASPEAARRRGEASVAGHTGDEAAARAFFDDPDAGVRAAALGALVRMGAATPGDAARALSDPDARARRYACELGATLPGADFGALLSDPDETVLEAACFAAGEVRDSGRCPPSSRSPPGTLTPSAGSRPWRRSEPSASEAACRR